MRMSCISSFISSPNVSFSLKQHGPLFAGLFTKVGFPQPDCIVDVSGELGAENKTWINKLKQSAKLSSFLKGTRGLHYLAMLEIISFIQLKFPPSVAIWHNNACALLPKSVLDLMPPETWKLDFKTCLINHHIL